MNWEVVGCIRKFYIVTFQMLNLCDNSYNMDASYSQDTIIMQGSELKTCTSSTANYLPGCLS